MEQYQVTGMSCAACSARVEKAVSKVPGVTSCSVSLLTNSMAVEGTADEAAIVAAVTEAGYGAKRKGAEPSAARPSEALEALEDRETPKLKRRLIASVGFLVVLMYLSMGHMMWGWPLPGFLAGNHVAMGLTADAADDHHHGHQPALLPQRLPAACCTARRIWTPSWPSAPRLPSATAPMRCLP